MGLGSHGPRPTRRQRQEDNTSTAAVKGVREGKAQSWFDSLDSGAMVVVEEELVSSTAFLSRLWQRRLLTLTLLQPA
jgi:hypothetical protein